MMCEEYDLGTARSEIVNNCGSDARGPTLRRKGDVRSCKEKSIGHIKLTVTITTFPCINLSARLTAPLKYHFRARIRRIHGSTFRIGQAKGILSRPLKKA